MLILFKYLDFKKFLNIGGLLIKVEKERHVYI